MKYIRVDKDGNVIGYFVTNCQIEADDLINVDDYVEIQTGFDMLGFPKYKYDFEKKEIIKNDYFNNQEYIEKLRFEKLRKLRDIRDSILNQADWIQSYLDSEREAIENGFITKEQRRWSKDEIKSYLLWKQTMRDLPQTIDINNFDIEDIVETNKELFPPCPIDPYLTRLPDDPAE